VVLDPESAWGHHGFVDSAANGPRGTALVTELIPALEERFRLVREPSARVVTGHSSGGWTALWLLVKYPETFGMAFASAPDPVDFTSFQTVDLYRDANLFTDATGTEQPAMRIPLGPGHDLVPMTVRDEVSMERAISPRGASGEQWDAWAAMWSPMDDRTGAPRRIANPVTGEIDPVTVEAWTGFDIARIARSDPAAADVIARRAQVLCGGRDSFYLDRAVTKLRDLLLPANREGSMGLIEVIPELDHGTMATIASARFHRQIREHFERSGHTGPDKEPVPEAPLPTEPAPAEPAPTEPAPTEPASAEPVPAEPAPAEPAPAEPAPAEPAPAEPEPAAP
jgi:pimeloyl-ACP methyl ester carboxylesterase